MILPLFWQVLMAESGKQPPGLGVGKSPAATNPQTSVLMDIGALSLEDPQQCCQDQQDEQE